MSAPVPVRMLRSRGLNKERIRCGAVFLDAGGTIVLPHRGLVVAALARVGIDIDPSAVERAHYRTARRLDQDPDVGRAPDVYLRFMCSELGVSADRLSEAVRALSQLADRGRSGEILWSEVTLRAQLTIAALQSAAIKVLVVTNSDGHAEQNLRDAAVCQPAAGAGVTVTAVIDSALVGSAKPDVGIFNAALGRAEVEPAAVVHVGDMLSSDIAGARAAGITPIHLDPHRLCRARDHRHVRWLGGIWRHVAPR